MLKAILTPIKSIRGRVRFFENLIRSRFLRPLPPQLLHFKFDDYSREYACSG